MSEFSAVVQAIVDERLEHEPVRATWAGIHDYDAELPDVSAAGIAESQELAQAHLAMLERWTNRELSSDDRIDHTLLTAQLQVQLRELAELAPHKHNPSLYPNLALDGVYSLLAREYAPLGQRLPALRSRLDKISAVFKAARANLIRSPQIWTETAIEE